MRRFALVALPLVSFLVVPHAFALHRTGIVELFTGITFCGQGSHVIFDPCPSSPDEGDLLEQNPFGELEPYQCQHVDLDGPDVGITCPGIVDPQTITVTAPGCSIDTRGMTIEGGSDAALSWWRTPCATSYDVVRGANPAGPIEGTVGIVTCIAEDVPQNTSFYPFIFGPTDSDMPDEGQVFIYFVRSNGAPYDGDTYGRDSNGTERVPFSGDCSP